MLTPAMRMALRYVDHFHAVAYARDIPGGKRTVDALERRGLVAYTDTRRVILTPTGRAHMGKVA